MHPYLSVIIPAYKEEKRIAKTLFAIDSYLRGVDYEYEILVVNDGSPDNTPAVVKGLEPKIKNLRLIGYETNRGKGAAVKFGMLEAKGKIRLFTDADNSTSIDHFERMKPWFDAGYQAVIGSRKVLGAVKDPPQPFYKTLMGDMGNIFIQVVILPGIWDTQCGFKAFTAEAAAKIFPYLKINRWGFDVEILALAKKTGYRVKEIPVHWVNDLMSHVKFSGYLQVLLETVKIRWWLWTGVYKI